ncbi:MAG: hypothetical protein RLZ83_978, partial [Pseudomonadota bacterium]
MSAPGTASAGEVTIHTLASASRELAAGRVRSVDLVEQSLERIAALDGQLHSHVRVTADRARAA